jgi:hypothetical protein
MKKSVTLSTLFLTLLLVLFSFSIISATPGDTCILNDDCDLGEICENEECAVIELIDTEADSTEAVVKEAPSEDKTEKAFECLEEKASDCSGLTTQEIALTIMATPDNIFDDCVSELEGRKSSDNWGNVRDTALAIIALKHAGKDTSSSEEWLLAQNKTPSDLIWYLQQDSNSEVECHIGYDSNDYIIGISEDKKIDKDAGPCLTRAQSNFWLQVSSNCYNENFQVECDKDFIISLIYRNKNSPTIYVLEGTSTAPAFGSVDLQVKSKCFGDNECDYETTVWAALALLETKHNVDEFIPYIIAMSQTNKQYLPEAFIFILTNYEDYAGSLISEQKLGNYWEAKSSAYDKSYDTGLALLALASSTSEQVENAKDWAFFSQGGSGCWQNSVRDTAMMLWALEGRAAKVMTPGSSVTYCAEASYFCIPSTECLGAEDVGDNYFCPALSDTCCVSENLKTCMEYMGETCAFDEVCTGNSRKSSDTNDCCLGSCEERAQESECEENSYTCMDSCSEYQESVSSYSCSQGQICCRAKPTPSDEGSAWWIWLLIILILILLIAIIYIYREQAKLYWFQLKTKFKKDDGKKSGSSGTRPKGVPPRPGFPPVRRSSPSSSSGRVPSRTSPQRRSYDRRDGAMTDTFQRLRDMSK